MLASALDVVKAQAALAGRPFGVRWLDSAILGGGLTPSLVVGCVKTVRPERFFACVKPQAGKSAVKPAHSKESPPRVKFPPFSSAASFPGCTLEAA